MIVSTGYRLEGLLLEVSNIHDSVKISKASLLRGQEI